MKSFVRSIKSFLGFTFFAGYMDLYARANLETSGI
jgi:hypothetical protein